LRNRKNKYAEKKNLKLNINRNNYILKTNDYENIEINEKFRATIESDKQKKEYEEKIIIM
jgi:hypothetical protein